MVKGTHFLGQPIFGQLISLLSKSEILKFSRENSGERYVKRFDSLRDISDSMFPEARKLAHLGIPQEMENRTPVQTVEAELSAEVFLRREHQCHKDTSLGDAHRKPAAHGAAEGIRRTWSFSRLVLMYYVNGYTFFESPEKDWAKIHEEAKEQPPEPSLLTDRGLGFQKEHPQSLFIGIADVYFTPY